MKRLIGYVQTAPVTIFPNSGRARFIRDSSPLILKPVNIVPERVRDVGRSRCGPREAQGVEKRLIVEGDRVEDLDRMLGKVTIVLIVGEARF